MTLPFSSYHNLREVLIYRNDYGIYYSFEERGMSWSKKGALSLLKVKETILNGKWDYWWKKEREHNIKLNPSKLPLAASSFTKEATSSPVIQARKPALSGPHQDKPWVGVLRKLTVAGYY